MRAGARGVAGVAGGVVLALGVFGLVPSLTTHYGNLAWGRGSGAELIGIFRVSVVLDLIHVALGLGVLAIARTHVRAVFALAGAGIACLALELIGAAKDGTWLALNAADDWLHLVLGVVLLAVACWTAAPE